MYNLNFYIKKRGDFETFFDERSSLIIQFGNGDITKKQFLEYNYDLVMNMHLKPFYKVDSYEKGMYNYQYYNVLAKYFKMMAKSVKNTRKHNRYYNYYLNKGNNYYHEKDKATLDLITYLEFKNMEAYYIKMNSKSLDDKLFEIVLLNYEEAIFHSKAIWLLDILKEKNVFKDKKKVSLIDGYINESY